MYLLYIDYSLNTVIYEYKLLFRHIDRHYYIHGNYIIIV